MRIHTRTHAAFAARICYDSPVESSVTLPLTSLAAGGEALGRLPKSRAQLLQQL